MKLKAKLISVALLAAACGVASQSYAEDWAISAQVGCKTELGSTVSSGGGLKASGGTAVVSCPIVKEYGSSAVNNIYARIKRASSSGADSFCYSYNSSNYGSPTNYNYAFASTTVGNQSLSVPVGTQYSSGYSDVYCVLVQNDILFGVRYLQDN